MLSVSDINRYLTGRFMYHCIHKEAPEMFFNLFHRNRHHDHGTRHSEDLHVPCGRIDVRQFSIKIHVTKFWNSVPNQTRNTQFIYMIKQQFRNYLIESWVLYHKYFKYVNYVHIWYDCACWWIMYGVGFILISCSYFIWPWGTAEPQWVYKWTHHIEMHLSTNTCVDVDDAGQWRRNHISRVNSSNSGTNKPKLISVFPMLNDMIVYLPE